MPQTNIAVFGNLPHLPGRPEWTQSDAAALRVYLSKGEGQLLLRSLLYARPSVTDRGNSIARQIQSDERTGFEACISEILSLAEPDFVHESAPSEQQAT
jgi:hypothetical protein